MKRVIPITKVDTRKQLLLNSDPMQISINYEAALKDINCSKKYLFENINYGNANLNWKKCVDLISEMESKNKGSKIITEFKNTFLNDIFPRIKDVNTVFEYASTKFDKEFIEKLEESNKVYIECDRLISNDKKISKRFNINQFLTENNFDDLESKVESVCELIDTYNDINIASKLNITLETVLYSFNKLGFSLESSDIIKYVTEYYLRNNDVITDTDYSKICKVLETNSFFSEKDITEVNYLFNEQKSFNSKIDISAKDIDKKYQNLIKEANNCKSLKTAKIIIKKSFELIFASFVITAIVSFSVVLTLLIALFALTMIFVTSPITIIKAIKEENNNINTDNLDEEEKKRAKQVISFITKKLIELEANPIKECANMIDSIYESNNINNMSNNYNANDVYIMSISNQAIDNYIKESKDFADSDDVKTIIKSYKADQNKGFDKIKTALSHIYTKKPEKIIDDTPNIIEFIRNFAILGTIAISPAITLIMFCADKYIEMNLKRKEAERVCKYFKAEKVKIEKKIDKANGEKRDRLDEYLQSLDKCIDKLDSYREDLYSDDELNRLYELEEASSINWLNKIPIDEYFSNHIHENICNNMSRAIQLFKNELLTKKYIGLEIEEYESNVGEKISSTFKKVDKNILIKYYITPDGMINVPLFRISRNRLANLNNIDAYSVITDICAFINDYLSDKCIVTNYLENNDIYIIFNYLYCLSVEEEPDIDYSATEEVREQFSIIEAMAEAVEEIENLYPIDTMKDMFKNIDKLVADDIDLISYMAMNTKCVELEDIKEALEDYKSSSDNSIINTNISMALYNMKNTNSLSSLNQIEQTMIQLESLYLLKEIIEESKQGNKRAVDLVKEKVSSAKINNNNQKNKVAITTNLGLAAEALKKKASNFSTKEKETSRNVDITLSQFRKGIENSLTTDKRESIIRGSIVPSFSKIIKTGMVAGGAYLINPVVAAIGAIGALACSKALTEKERRLLLDEIDIELKVVEKQISVVENDGKIKEYRQLLTYQRKLQREKQRIIYRLRITGRDNILDVNDKED